jgi:hypothetical protein
LVTVADDPRIRSRWGEVRDGTFAEYNQHGDVLNEYWGRLFDDKPDFQFLLLDGNTPVGLGQTIPFAWDGTVQDLPSGIDGVIVRGFEDNRPPTTLSALLAVVAPSRRTQGISSEIIRAMGRVASRHQLDDLVAPLRPSRKHLYPLAPIERYMAWTREDGLPLDPWIRVHVRLGGEFLRPEPKSLRITGTVGEWEEWTGMVFPETGEYVFPRRFVDGLDRS